MARTGRAVIAHHQKFEIREFPVPAPAPNTVLLRQELAGICGTDLHNWQKGFREEMLLGHENVGIIDSLGKGVERDYVGQPLREGDRVIFAPRTPHGVYGYQTKPGQPPHFGGGFADYIYLSYPDTCIIKTTAPPQVAVLTEPFAIAVHGAMRTGVQIGDTVVIQGSGAIGLMSLVCARISGAAKIIMVGGPAKRLELARRMSADVTIDIEETPSVAERTERVKAETPRQEGADVVFECAGFLPAIPEGLGYLRYGGTFCELGHFVDVGSIDFNPTRLLVDLNVRLEAVRSSRYEHFVRGLPILERNDFPFAEMVSHRLPLTEVRQGFEALNGDYRLGDETVIKIAIQSAG